MLLVLVYTDVDVVAVVFCQLRQQQRSSQQLLAVAFATFVCVCPT